MHLNEHVSIDKQPMTSQSPQSLWQFEHVSYGSSHLSLPQTAHTPQSVSQDAHVSGGEQCPSPQPAHFPQSSGHVKQSSVLASQRPSPQLAHFPQSGAQVRHVSSLQKPSPHAAQPPQSRGHEEHVSPVAHLPSPQPAQSPQSTEQVVQLSPPPHVPSPHPGGMVLPEPASAPLDGVLSAAFSNGPVRLPHAAASSPASIAAVKIPVNRPIPRESVSDRGSPQGQRMVGCVAAASCTGAAASLFTFFSVRSTLWTTPGATVSSASALASICECVVEIFSFPAGSPSMR